MPSYLVTFHTLGTWLHGHVEGSVDRDDNTPNTPRLPPNVLLETYEASNLKAGVVTLDAEQRWVVSHTIAEVCTFRGWTLHAVNPRTTHVHAVISAADPPGKVMDDLKAWCTRRMRESGVFDLEAKPWGRGGSKRWLNTENSFRQAVNYVLKEQGPDLPQCQPPGWQTRTMGKKESGAEAGKK